MNLSRKEFFAKACLSGACLCGFGSLAFSNNNATSETTNQPDEKLLLLQKYIGSLLLNMQENLTEEQNRKVIRELAEIHYNSINMDELMKPFENNLDAFIRFLENDWKWKVTFDKEKRILIADENKNFCVCPMINLKSGIKPAAICYCSEGFAERMFSKAAGKKVTARVISSIHRGDDRCKYEVQISN